MAATPDADGLAATAPARGTTRLLHNPSTIETMTNAETPGHAGADARIVEAAGAGPGIVEEDLVEEDLVEEDLVEEDLLVEEISIDGMCGVY